MKRQSLDQLLGSKVQEPYVVQYQYIRQLIKDGKIKPVGTSPKNGKKPVLYTEYWVIEEKKDYSELEHELLYQTDPQIAVDYYIRNPEIYIKERDAVRMLNTFIREKKEQLTVQVSFNERCFEIWGHEKFLSKSAGRTVLKHCGLDLNYLNCYPTAEPFAYYAASRIAPQKILIVENKDPFFSMRKHLLSGHNTIFGEEIHTLIYGAGKRVVSSFKEFSISAEPYMRDENNVLLYWGDLDYEGIGIYEVLSDVFSEQGKIVPFVAAYQAMLNKAERAVRLPETKEQQNRNIKMEFYSFFGDMTISRMKHILEQGLYIPQEILNITDF